VIAIYFDRRCVVALFRE